MKRLNDDKIATPSICIITPSYLSNTPRVVKEADALHEAGFNVRVVFTQGGDIGHLRMDDDDLLSKHDWATDIVHWSRLEPAERWLFQLSRCRHFVWRKLPTVFWSIYGVIETAEGRVFPELARLTAHKHADIYIGHYLDGFAAAAFAAQRRGSLLGYDAEDLHSEFGQDTMTRMRAEAIEKRYLRRCVHLTAASELMASNIAERYQVRMPVPIHNVFPWADRQALDGHIKDRRGETLSIYWYSQTIGLDRGIQDLICAAGLMSYPVQIHLRGAISPHIKHALCTLAGECGVLDRMYFHERVPPTELLSRAVEHDVGLAAEQPVDLSRQISVTNKMFLYLLAGLCIMATDVPGQRRILEQIPNAGFLYPVGDYQALAKLLTRLVEDSDLLRRLKSAALQEAKDRWNWEIESRKLVSAVQNALASQSGT